MVDRKNVFLGILVSMIVMGSMPAIAGEELSFNTRRFRTVNPGPCGFVTCASVQFTAPADGFVVVTASGMARFRSDLSFLELTLSQQPDDRGPWLFQLTPGFNLVQGFSVQYVFPVSAGANRTYHLNGSSCGGPGGSIRVETGSITAEFYSSANTQRQLAPAELEEGSGPTQPRGVDFH